MLPEFDSPHSALYRTVSPHDEFSSMNKPVGTTVFLVVLVGIGFAWFQRDDASDAQDEPSSGGAWRVERVDEGTVLRVLDDADAERMRYSIDAFNEWTQAHWDDVFDERPSFGDLREVEFTRFRRFDRGASVSPQGDALAFSVSDYAAASTMSFVAILDVASEEVVLVDAANRGGIDDLHWSPDGRYVAYRLHTARAHGDALSVDRPDAAEKMFSLDGDALLAALPGTDGTDPSSFRPEISDLTWTNEGRLSFTSRSPHGGQIRWQVEADGADLERVD